MENEINICRDCGEETTNTIKLYTGDTVYICDECLENYTLCDDCGDYFSKDADSYLITKDGDYICQYCSEHYNYCAHCEEYVHEDYIHTVIKSDGSEEFWCESCCESAAYVCDDCGEYTSYNAGDSTTCLCESCSDNWYRCDECGELFPYDDMYYCEEDDNRYCESCYSNRPPVHAYSYEPELMFIRDEDDDLDSVSHPLYMGFELECGGATSSECKDAANDIESLGKDIYLKSDGSIPEYGFEIVSHPMTLSVHENAGWDDVLTSAVSNGLRSHDLGPSACGLHVHASRNFMRAERWVILDWFVSKHKTVFEKIARREETHWAEFKAPAPTAHLKDAYGRSSSRYQAVNFSNRNTVEFRMFRGTLKYETFIATLEIVDALVRWAKQVHVADIISDKKGFCTFTKYIIKNSNRYKYAIDYLKGKEIM